MKCYSFFLLLLLLSQTHSLAAQQDMQGLSYSLSDCASGGPQYYFFGDGSLLRICSGCDESSPNVQKGRWASKADGVHIFLRESWIGKATGNIIPPCASICVYDEYTPTYSKIQENELISLLDLEDVQGASCASLQMHQLKNSDPHSFLRIDFVGQYPQASQRLLKSSELSGLTKKQLQIMRNEIFARYGYEFKSQAMKDYFKAQKGYYPRFKQVDAFLSAIEKENIQLIKKQEGL